MKLTIEVKDPKEAEVFKRAFADPTVRDLLVITIGLLTLPDAQAKIILNDLNEALEEFKNAANVRGEKV